MAKFVYLEVSSDAGVKGKVLRFLSESEAVPAELEQGAEESTWEKWKQTMPEEWKKEDGTILDPEFGELDPETGEPKA